MERSEYDLIYAVEMRHWWYRGMASISRAVIERYYSPGKNLRILDAGCGTGGAIATFLADYGQVTGFDLSKDALHYCCVRRLQAVACASVSAIPFGYSSFDLVTSFDVLYERSVNNETDALRELHRVTVPGGRLLLRLPAYHWLHSHHDEIVHTARRFTSKQVARLLLDSGWNVDHLSYANSILFPLVLLKRLAEKLAPGQKPTSDLEVNVGWLSGAFQRILAGEAHAVAGVGLPFGLSIIAVGRKPA